jgi:hypothetical protein
MNYITYRYKLSKLNSKRKYFEKSTLKDITEARKNGSKEKLEKLYSLLNANNIYYEKNKCKLLTRYILLQY